MNGLQKQINYLLLFSFLLTMFLPCAVFAEEDKESEREKGQMEIRTDRITEYRDQINEVFRETELQKRLPTLFEQWTVDRIEQKQDEVADITGKLKHRILLEEVEEDSYVDEVKNVLFTDEYVVASSSATDNEEKSKSEILSTSIIVASLILFAVVLCIGIYFFIKKWNASE